MKIPRYQLINKMEKITNRYIEAENFLMQLKWYEKLFCRRKIKRFLKSRIEKYNF